MHNGGEGMRSLCEEEGGLPRIGVHGRIEHKLAELPLIWLSLARVRALGIVAILQQSCSNVLAMFKQCFRNVVYML